MDDRSRETSPESGLFFTATLKIATEKAAAFGDPRKIPVLNSKVSQPMDTMPVPSPPPSIPQMSLAHQQIRQGEWLFRWRSYLPLIMVGLLVLAMWEGSAAPGHRAGNDPIWGFTCLMLSFFGLAIRIFALGHAPADTSGRTTNAPRAGLLNKSGAYSLVRHPLYLGNFFITLGIVVSIQDAWILALCVAMFWIYYERIMLAEEAFLRERFGTEFESWARGTPAFLPRLRGWRPPELPFSVRNVIRREYSGFFGILATFAFLDFAGNLMGSRGAVLHPFWGWSIALGGILFLVARTLKKKTKLLQVEGR